VSVGKRQPLGFVHLAAGNLLAASQAENCQQKKELAWKVLAVPRSLLLQGTAM
jgi:hypothetical protein